MATQTIELKKQVREYMEAPERKGKKFLIVWTKAREGKIVDELAREYDCNTGQNDGLNPFRTKEIIAELKGLNRRIKSDISNGDDNKEIENLKRNLKEKLTNKFQYEVETILLLNNLELNIIELKNQQTNASNKNATETTIPPKQEPPNSPPIKIEEKIDKINGKIENNPELSQLKKIKYEADTEDWDRLIKWLIKQAKKSVSRAFDPLADLWFDVNFERARNDVKKLKKKYLDRTNDEIAEILIRETAWKATTSSYTGDFINNLTSDQQIRDILEDASSKCGLKTVTQECAEMVYKIAGIYDFELEHPMRQFESLAAFGTAWLGKRASDMFIKSLGLNLFNAMNVNALSHASLIVMVGNCAQLIYREQSSNKTNILSDEEAFYQVKEEVECSVFYKKANREDWIQLIVEEIASKPPATPPTPPTPKPTPPTPKPTPPTPKPTPPTPKPTPPTPKPTPPEKITLQYKLTREDLIKAYNFEKSPGLICWKIYNNVRCLLLFLSVYFLFFGGIENEIFKYSPLILLATLCFLFPKLYWHLFVSKKNSQLYDRNKPYMTAKSQTFIFPDRIKITGSELETFERKLTDFHKYKCCDDFILLYLSETEPLLFPHQCFTSKEDYETFISYLKKHLGDPC
ncbi:hypothetical protein [Lyngbya sp. CCY1209]|uniref:hypothetical protein n=1 Tax=Lyngbya sp. CCY1209 TaxID=2886103 RepID=UPI002D200D74|nr:hypothetical protein [Lyngbya sp. CCY1209]MEB3884094.1 hypothetical protein [Lyngbya sp. CCY1209]